MSKLFELLESLESPNTSDNLRDDLEEIYSDPDYELISNYFVIKIRAGISFDKLFHVMNNLNKHPTMLGSVSLRLNEVIIWMYYSKEHPEYLYNLLDRDPRLKCSLLYNLGMFLFSLTVNDANIFVKDISNNTNCSQCDLYYSILTSSSRSTVRPIMILDELEPEIIHDLLVQTCLAGHYLFPIIRDQLFKSDQTFYKCLESRLNDNYGICLALTKSPISIVSSISLVGCIALLLRLSSKNWRCPSTDGCESSVSSSFTA